MDDVVLGQDQDGRDRFGVQANESMPAPADDGGQIWTQVDSGREHGCAVRADHTLWCWGQGDTASSAMARR